MPVKIHRLLDAPIIHPGLDPSLGDNINGPSLIRVPEWIVSPLARYYLYFAHHEGKSIRLAYADTLTGPWRIHRPGAIRLDQTPLPQTPPSVPQPAWAVAKGVEGLYPHIASPDVHIDTAQRRLTMYFHGLDHSGEQVSLTATSSDGLNWQLAGPMIDQVYLRAFHHGGTGYAMAWAGQILHATPNGGFEPGPMPFPPGHRHCAVLVRGNILHVLWTRIGDAPERILHSTIGLSGNWQDWRLGDTAQVLRPERSWEGADLPITASEIGTATHFEHALRDPCFFEESGRLYLIYAGGGEAALGLAEITGL
ncbi:MAG TPA: hypothetical protein VMY41_02365 [Thermohalobaculum sp.]|nr:hypothetical protein [Thermohalobaculum sp.]